MVKKYYSSKADEDEKKQEDADAKKMRPDSNPKKVGQGINETLNQTNLSKMESSKLLGDSMTQYWGKEKVEREIINYFQTQNIWTFSITYVKTFI